VSTLYGGEGGGVQVYGRGGATAGCLVGRECGRAALAEAAAHSCARCCNAERHTARTAHVSPPHGAVFAPRKCILPGTVASGHGLMAGAPSPSRGQPRRALACD